MAILKDYIDLDIGDIVVIDKRYNLSADPPASFIRLMSEYEGKTGVITRTDKIYHSYTRFRYRIDIDGECFKWTIDMFKYVKKKGSNLLYEVKKRPDLY